MYTSKSIVNIFAYNREKLYKKKNVFNIKAMYELTFYGPAFYGKYINRVFGTLKSNDRNTFNYHFQNYTSIFF